VTWAKLSDDVYDHPKVVELQNMGAERAFTLWVLGMAYCMRHLTDGLITAAVVRKLGYGKREIRDLITVGLWDEVAPNAEWQYHDWLQYQRSRAQVLADREANAARKRKHDSKARGNGGSNGVTDGVTHNGSNTPPDQTRPDQVLNAYGDRIHS